MIILNNNLNFYIILLIILLIIFFYNFESFESLSNVIVTDITDVVSELTEIEPEIKLTNFKESNNFNISDYIESDYSNILPKIETSYNRIQKESNKNIVPTNNNNTILKTATITCKHNTYTYLTGEGKCQSQCLSGFIQDGNKCKKQTTGDAILENAEKTLQCEKDYNLTIICIKNDNENEYVDTTYNGDELLCESGYTKKKICKVKDPINNSPLYVKPQEVYSCPLDINFKSGILNTYNNQCYKCPDNYELNNNYKCIHTELKQREIVDAICPNEYVFDKLQDKCVKTECIDDTFIYNIDTKMCYKCPQNYRFDNNLKTCIANSKCPTNYVYDITNNKCNLYKCPSNFYLDLSKNTCIAKDLINGSCTNGTYENYKCKICNGTDIKNKCLKCDDNNNLVMINNEYKCVKCPDKYNFDISLNKCVSENYYCNNEIQNTSEPSICNSCPDNYYFNDILKKCIHNKCSVNNMIDNKCYDCDGFIEKTNDGNIKCYTCPSGYIHDHDNIKNCIPINTNTQQIIENYTNEYSQSQTYQDYDINVQPDIEYYTNTNFFQKYLEPPNNNTTSEEYESSDNESSDNESSDNESL